MSRLIIKNLPPYATPSLLQSHFTQAGCPSGTLTDVKVAFKADGTSRRFGFVGYKTEAEAKAAKEWFDKTFVDSVRIRVDVVEGAKDAPTPRPNKRPRLGPSPIESSEPKRVKDPKDISREDKDGSKKLRSDAQLEDFMRVMQPRTKNGPSWANEAQPQPSTSAKTLDAPVQEEAKNMEVDEDQDMQDEEEEPREEGLSDMDWLRKRMKQNVEGEGRSEKVFEQSDDEDEDGVDGRKDSPSNEPQEPQDPTRTTILQTSRLFVRNLAFSCTEAELQELFSQYGQVSKVHIPLDPLSRQSKGLAYITFAQPSDAVAAYESLDKTSFQGRLLHILAAVDRRGADDGNGEGEGGRKKSVKEEKKSKLKSVSGKEFNWAMLYMNSDAVASSIASRLSIPKSAILNPDSSSDPSDATSSTSAAVKLALAETHIINETKSYLESNGVLLESFSSSRTARSDTVILVKNIPYGTSEAQIRELFEPHGEVNRVLLPPAGTIAVVEFDKPDEAGKAFKAVAYRRLGNSVVYLEKAPMGIFSGSSTSAEKKEQPVVQDSVAAHAVKIPEQEAGANATTGDEPALSSGTTLFVKNLAFATTTERLTQIFRNLPSFAFARVQTKPDPKKPGGKLSMGYGFVGFKDAEGARKAMKSMQSFVLDGHALHIKFAGRGAEEESGKDKAAGGVGSKSRTTKMIVKNVPFEASKKDIRDLFGSHGQLKSVRLPKKFDSRTRGFAFLEFVSRTEAENAYEALRHTHLLGRHLVLEWAAEEGGEEELEKMRKKAGVGVGVGVGGKEMPGRKRKLDFGGVGEGEGEEED